MKTAALLLHLKKRSGFLRSRPAIYIGIIFCGVLAGLAYKFRTETIFACAAKGYSSDWYMASCTGKAYGDYDHGAFVFGLEPSADEFARNAGVLFLGNSRLQLAFSTEAASNWFSAASARYYLLGFSQYANMVLADAVLCRINPNAKVYVINIDDFFEQWEAPAIKEVLHDPGAQNRIELKRLWQRIHEPLCTRFPRLCGDKFAVFRSRRTGAYSYAGGKITTVPVSYDPVTNPDAVAYLTPFAIDFISRLPAGRKCILLTMVPTVDTKMGNANAIAAAVGERLITPGVLPGLETRDGSHLNKASAERWSKAFFEIAGPKIKACLEEQQSGG